MEAADSRPCRGVALWLKWLVNKGGGGPPFATNVPVESMWDGFGKLKRERLLDRYHQHTQHCAACSQVPPAHSRCQFLSAGCKMTVTFGITLDCQVHVPWCWASIVRVFEVLVATCRP